MSLAIEVFSTPNLSLHIILHCKWCFHCQNYHPRFSFAPSDNLYHNELVEITHKAKLWDYILEREFFYYRGTKFIYVTCDIIVVFFNCRYVYYFNSLSIFFSFSFFLRFLSLSFFLFFFLFLLSLPLLIYTSFSPILLLCIVPYIYENDWDFFFLFIFFWSIWFLRFDY